MTALEWPPYSMKLACTAAAAAALLALAPTPASAAAKAPKQGFSGYLGGYSTCGDSAALGLAGNWYYTWLHEPAQGKVCDKGAIPPGEFAPMVINRNMAANLNTPATAKKWAEAGARYLLGYNEPDYGNGHNHPHMMSPQEAAEDWPDMQALAKATGLTLVSPALSTTGLNNAGESHWLDEFFGNCTHVVAACDPDSIKHIAFHDYNGDPDRIIARAEGLFKRYNRSVWITEFAINRWSVGYAPTRAQQDAFMAKVLPVLEASDVIDRYAWYSARDQPSQGGAPDGGGNLLEWNVTKPTLTSTGTVYRQHALAQAQQPSVSSSASAAAAASAASAAAAVTLAAAATTA